MFSGMRITSSLHVYFFVTVANDACFVRYNTICFHRCNQFSFYCELLNILQNQTVRDERETTAILENV